MQSIKKYVKEEEETKEDKENNNENKEDKNNKNESKFECNICFDEVKEPVVTRCGHLFCWSCLLSWMNRNNYKCPMCQAGISRENVIPLYGHGQEQTDPRNKPEEPRPRGERPRFRRRVNPFFRGYDSGISISFGAFPFSFVLPIGFGTTHPGSSLLNFFRPENSENMTTQQRRAYAHSTFFFLMGFLMILYLLFCV